MLGKFGSVVEGNRLDPGCGELDEQSGDGVCDDVGVFAEDFDRAQYPCASFNERHQKAVLVLAENRVGFPVAGFAAFFDVCGASFNVDPVRDGRSSAGFSLSSFSTFWTRLR